MQPFDTHAFFSADRPSRPIAVYPFLYRAAYKQTLVCLLPKAGSSTWTHALLRGATRSINVSHADFVVAQASALTRRITIVRHPQARLLSAWLGKVVHAPQPTTWPTGYNGRGGFATLVSYMINNPSTVYGKPHFSLQRDQCAGKPLGPAPWRVLRIEEIEKWYEPLVCELGISWAVTSGWHFQRLFATSSDGKPVGAEQECMVKTSCGCSIDCERMCPNATSAVHGSFRLTTFHMARFYNPKVLQLTTRYVQPDLDAFFYRPYDPKKPLRDTLLSQ